jgi:hypothetical protein
VVVFVIVVFRRLQQLVSRSALRLFLGSVGGRLLGDALPAPAAVVLLFSVVLVRFLSRVQFTLPCVPGFLFVGAIVLHIVWLGGCHVGVFFVCVAFAPAQKFAIFYKRVSKYGHLNEKTHKDFFLRFFNCSGFFCGSSAAEEISSSSFLLSSGSTDSSP